jgi:hypothetical protein
MGNLIDHVIAHAADGFVVGRVRDGLKRMAGVTNATSSANQPLFRAAFQTAPRQEIQSKRSAIFMRTPAPSQRSAAKRKFPD